MPIVVIAKNQTAGSIQLGNLGVTLPASPSSVILTDFLFISEIQSDEELRTEVSSSNVVINDGTSDLTTDIALKFLDPTDDDFFSLGDLVDVQVPDSPVGEPVLVFSQSLGKYALKQSTTLDLGAIEADLQNAVAVTGSATSSTVYVDVPGCLLFASGTSDTPKRYLVTFSGGFQSDKANRAVGVILNVSGTEIPGSERSQVIASANAEQVLATNWTTVPLENGSEIKALYKRGGANATVTVVQATLSIVGVIVE